ncbi:42372_t:CDS:2, partial [Gigaspora margarita]
AVTAREKLVQYYSKTNATVMLCTVLNPQKKFHYYVRKEFPNDEIKGTKAFISGNTIKSHTQSILDDNFEKNEENTDELDRYILEKLASKEINVLA